MIRQAMAGMMWSAVLPSTLTHGWPSAAPISSRARRARVPQRHWHHMGNSDIISMPDKWEYPCTRQDLAFPCSL